MRRHDIHRLFQEVRNRKKNAGVICLLLEKNRLGSYIYETLKITRFTDFHPTHNSEGFFLTSSFALFLLETKMNFFLLQTIKKNYVRECHTRGIISSLNTIQKFLLEYAHRNLIDTKKTISII